jgi:glycosidase
MNKPSASNTSLLRGKREVAIQWSKALLIGGASLLCCVTPVKPIQPPVTDCTLHWSEVRHDTFDPNYRSVIGAVTVNQPISLRLRAQKNGLSSARLRLWNDTLNQESYLPLQKVSTDGAFDWWSVTFPTGETPTIFYYFFELNDAFQGCQPKQGFYVDDDTLRYGGGSGTVIDAYDDWRSFQLTVYDPAFQSPEWSKGAVVYQIFPDRFRDGDRANNPSPKRAFYDDPNGVILRSNTDDWSAPVCDPRGALPNACPGVYGQNFYGGDLKGITHSIEEGYFNSVDALYLNPITRAPSNHRYDPYNWSELEPELGTVQELQRLISIAKAHQLRLILDGVFHHISSDSPWFDRYHHHPEEGACEAKTSSYRSLFTFSTQKTTPDALCAEEYYKTFGAYSSLVKVAHDNKKARQMVLQSVAKWNALGVSGWRLDAAPDIDPGVTNDPNNSYWEEFRQEVKHDPSQLIIGEAWGDASPWLLGSEWDSATNYRLQGALLSWLFSRCTGSGCREGIAFSDGDHNAQSFSGELQKISLAQFNARLLSIWEDYPPEAFASLMNIIGTHDTNRVLFLLKKISHEDPQQAQEKLRLAWLFLLTYPGMPTIYYGDEAGIDTAGVWDGSVWQDDPYNRATLPEKPRFDPFLQKLSELRRAHPILQKGAIIHGVVIDEERQLYGFVRVLDSKAALIILNRSAQAQRLTINLSSWFSPDASLIELLSGIFYQTKGGSLSVSIEAMRGVILLGP